MKELQLLWQMQTIIKQEPLKQKGRVTAAIDQKTEHLKMSLKDDLIDLQ